MEETREKLRSLREQTGKAREAEVRISPPPEAISPPEEVRRKAWYEAYRWFISSDGFLVVAGKDAASNEALVKKHAEAGDLLLHADIHGAPFVLIKAGGREVPRTTLEEAAQVAVAYSRAWRYGLGAATAFCFKPDQARKVGPHGEKLPKGAFYIAGRKDYVRKVRPQLAIGVSPEAEKKVLVGPVGAIASRAKAYVVIGPGDLKAEEVISRSLSLLRKMLGDIPLPPGAEASLSSLIPYGRGRVISGPHRGRAGERPSD